LCLLAGDWPAAAPSPCSSGTPARRNQAPSSVWPSWFSSISFPTWCLIWYTLRCTVVVFTSVAKLCVYIVIYQFGYIIIIIINLFSARIPVNLVALLRYVHIKYSYLPYSRFFKSFHACLICSLK
jgi:hypothetical protein